MTAEEGARLTHACCAHTCAARALIHAYTLGQRGKAPGRGTPPWGALRGGCKGSLPPWDMPARGGGISPASTGQCLLLHSVDLRRRIITSQQAKPRNDRLFILLPLSGVVQVIASLLALLLEIYL